MKALDSAWDRIRQEDPRVPEVSFYLTSGLASSCATASFEEEDPVLRINLQHDGVNLTGAPIMEWLLHSAAHAVAGPSTSSEGRWHTVAFRDAAEGLGLAVEKGPTGWGETSLARGTKARYKDEIAAIDQAMKSWYPVTTRRRPRVADKYVCSCDPPRIIRVNPGVIAKGEIRCEICGEPFRAG